MKKLLAALVLAPLFLVGCGAQKPEKDRFISATKDVTCLIFKTKDLTDPTLEGKSKDIFKNYGFNVDDNAAMQAIADKYKDDADVKTAVEASVKECGGDLTKTMGGLDTSKVDTKAAAPSAPAESAAKESTKADVKEDTTTAPAVTGGNSASKETTNPAATDTTAPKAGTLDATVVPATK